MTLFIDARIPVVFGAAMPGPADAILVPDPSWDAAQHPAGCGCCGARGPAALALDRLFQARVRGEIPWFDRVVAPREAGALLGEAIAADALSAARFRLG